MLAYELYLKNRSSDREFGKQYLLKKVFFSGKNAEKIEFDETPLEKYGLRREDYRPGSEQVQEALSLPVSYPKSIGLPNRTTGSGSSKPYVEIYGTFQKTKLALSVSGKNKNGKKESLSYKMDFESGEEHTEGTGKIRLRLDGAHYFMDGEPLLSLYKKRGLVDENQYLSAETFLQTCKAFRDFCQKKGMPDVLPNISKKCGFRLVLLPGKNPVQFMADEEQESESPFVDSFGVKASRYPAGTTQTASFLSYDDPAFTLNTKQKRAFYRQLGLGAKAFEKVNLPPGESFSIAGLSWMFVDLISPQRVFRRSGAGIYDQLAHNCEELAKNSGSTPSESQLKIVCLKETQAKLEVLIDENLTLSQLKERLLLDAGPDATKRPMAVESLIQRQGRTTYWSDYLDAVKALLAGRWYDRHRLRRVFERKLKSNLHDWIHSPKGAKEAGRFFEQSFFCLQLLTKEGREGHLMDSAEQYAYGIGKIAGKYVRFKRDAEEATGSTNDMLAYSAYNREKLRHVFNLVGRGLNLSNAEESKKALVQAFIGENAPKEEIPDELAGRDGSYFFYKGVFEELYNKE